MNDRAWRLIIALSAAAYGSTAASWTNSSNVRPGSPTTGSMVTTTTITNITTNFDITLITTNANAKAGSMTSSISIKIEDGLATENTENSQFPLCPLCALWLIRTSHF